MCFYYHLFVIVVFHFFYKKDLLLILMLPIFLEKKFLSWYYILKIYFKLYYSIYSLCNSIYFGQIIVLDNKAVAGGWKRNVFCLFNFILFYFFFTKCKFLHFMFLCISKYLFLIPLVTGVHWRDMRT